MNIPWKAQLGIGVAVLVVGIFAFSGLLEIFLAVSGVLLMANARQRRERE